MSVPFTIGHFVDWSQRLILDNGEPWKLERYQTDFFEDVFVGYPVTWLVVPEGNGKTTMLAGLGLYGLRYGDDPMIPIAASSRDQVRIMYRQAKGLVRRSNLDEKDLWFECFDGYRRVDLRSTGRTKRGDVVGSIECHAADAGTADGVIFSPFAFLDELHRQSSLDLFETWRGKHEKREGQLVGISTAGEPGAPFEEARASIRAKGKITVDKQTFHRYEHERIVMHEWSLPEDGNPEDMKLVAKANPLSSLTPSALKSKRSDPTMTLAHWRRFNCNLAAFGSEIELFVPMQDWDARAVGDLIPEGAEVCLGVDGSRTWDTTVVAWASSDGEFVDVDARVFSVRGDQPLHVLHRGGKIDFEDVEEYIVSAFDHYGVAEVAYDPRYLERSMDIVEARLPESAVHAVEPQSKVMRNALQDFYRLIAEGKLRHRGDPVIRSHIENSKVERYEGTQEIRRIGKVDRRKAIDAVPAMAMAVWCAWRVAERGGEMVWAVA